jgi:hypothetical protein
MSRQPGSAADSSPAFDAASKRGLSGGANAADDWRAGGVSAFKTQAEPAFGDTGVGR